MENSISEYRLGDSTTAEGMTIIPIEEVIYSADGNGDGLWANGKIDPVAVIIVSSGRVKVVDIEGAEISMQDINEMAPNLTDILSQRISQISDDDADW